MEIGWGDFVTALGLAAVIEGALYALFPGPARQMWRVVAAMDDGKLRAVGLAISVFGLALVWLVRR